MKFRADLVRSFPGDPTKVRSEEDIARLERIPIDERLPYRSTKELLESSSELYGQATAISFLPTGSASEEPLRWSYDAYLREVRSAANAFHQLGVRETEPVAFLMPNTPQLLIGIWGAEMAAIAMPLNPFLAPEHLASIIREAGARVLVAAGSALSPDAWHKALALMETSCGLERLIAVSPREEEDDWTALLAEQPSDQLSFERRLTGEETASYLHTGGTTGRPKIAVRSHRGEVVNVCQLLMVGPDDDDYAGRRRVILCGLPLFHASAYIAAALSAVAQGAELVLAGLEGFRNPRLIEDFWAIVERYQVSVFTVVPTVYAALLHQSNADRDIGSLLFGGSGGAPMSPQLMDEFTARTGAAVIEGYGMTECTAGATAHTFAGRRKPGSVGLRLPYMHIRVARKDDQQRILDDCRVGEPGTIFLRGPNVIKGYLAPEGLRPLGCEPGWLDSGDVGQFDEDGFLWIVGREKDLIIRGGHNIDPRISEESLQSHPMVRQVAAVGLPDAYAGELPLAFVELHPGSSVSAETLVAFGREHAAERAAAPVEVIILSELPQTAVGKIFKPTLRQAAVCLAYQRAIDKAAPGSGVAARVDTVTAATIGVVLDGFHAAGEAAGRAIEEALAPFTYRWRAAEAAGPEEEI